MCRGIIVILVFAGLGTGITAAVYWYWSSKVSIDPGWGYPGRPGPAEPGDPEAQQIAWTGATINAFSRLNRKASLWTAASVAINSIAAVIGMLA
jgi:hypothetical protein